MSGGRTGMGTAVLAAAAIALGLLAWFWWRGDTPDDAVSQTASREAAQVTRRQRAAPSDSPDVPRWLAVPGTRLEVAGVVRSNGQPVPGATVILSGPHVAAGFTEAWQVIADDDGRFRFPDVARLRLWLSAVAPEHGPATVELDLRKPDAQQLAQEVIVTLPDCSHKIAGTIRDASGGAVARATVRRVASDIDRTWFAEAWQGPSAVSDDDGGYELCVSVGRHEIEARAYGYGAAARGVTAYGTVQADFLLMPEGMVTGLVKSADGETIPGVMVEANYLSSSRRSHPSSASGQSDDNGRFAIAGLAPGTYSVSARGDRVMSVEPVEVPVTAGDSSEVTVVVEATTTISGRVTGTDGRPIAGAEVKVVRNAPWGQSDSGSADEHGAFALAAVPLGDIEVRVDGFAAEAPEELVASAAPMSNVEVVALRRRARISGRVVQNGSPIFGALVWAKESDGRGRRIEARSGNDGSFSYRNVRGGEYVLYAESERAGAFSPPVSISVDADNPRDIGGIELDLVYSATVRGVVINETGQPIPGLQVELSMRDGNDFGYASTSSDGTFQASQMTGGGVYAFSVKEPGTSTPLQAAGGGGFADVELSDSSSEVNLGTVRVQYETKSISGMVVDEGGGPVADVWLRAVPMRPGKSASWSLDPGLIGELGEKNGVTDVDGRFVIAGVSSGSHIIHARSSSGAESFVSPVAAGSSGVSITLETAAVLRGTITGFHSRPEVKATRIDGTSLIDARGQVTGERFELRGLAAGVYIVRAQAEEKQVAHARVRLEAADEKTVTLAAELANFVGVSLVVDNGADAHGIKCWAIRDGGQNADTDVFAAHQYPVAGGVPMAYFLLPSGEYSVHCENEVLTGDGRAVSPQNGSPITVSVVAR